MANTSNSKYATKTWPYGTSLTQAQVVKAQERINKILSKQIPNLFVEKEAMPSGKGFIFTVKDATLPENRNIVERYHRYDSGKFFFHNWKTFTKHAYIPA